MHFSVHLQVTLYYDISIWLNSYEWRKHLAGWLFTLVSNNIRWVVITQDGAPNCCFFLNQTRARDADIYSICTQKEESGGSNPRVALAMEKKVLKVITMNNVILCFKLTRDNDHSYFEMHL